MISAHNTATGEWRGICAGSIGTTCTRSISPAPARLSPSVPKILEHRSFRPRYRRAVPPPCRRHGQYRLQRRFALVVPAGQRLYVVVHEEPRVIFFEAAMVLAPRRIKILRENELSAEGRWIRISGSWSRTVKPSWETELLSRKRGPDLLGYRWFDRFSPSSGESTAKPTFVAKASSQAGHHRVWFWPGERGVETNSRRRVWEDQLVRDKLR